MAPPFFSCIIAWALFVSKGIPSKWRVGSSRVKLFSLETEVLEEKMLGYMVFPIYVIARKIDRTYSLFVNIVKSFCKWCLKRSSPNK